MKLRSDKQSIVREIEEQERLVVSLEKQKDSAQARLLTLRSKLAEFNSSNHVERGFIPPASDLRAAVKTVEEKVTLFRKLFRGREDVFPRWWSSTKTGRTGYTPACDNEWVSGLCDKKKTKCKDCSNRALSPVTDQVVVDHLRGKHIVGVYPLLQDETCWFLAADFDKESWQEDVAAFFVTCRKWEVPVSVERSRSGNGAHVWFFFERPVAASVARKMGCFLITETMANRHQLRMESYDRLFPNQDTMPDGGFGNLIALPLQKKVRELGNTVFLDDELKPIPNEQQWSYLDSVQRLAPLIVEGIVGEASRQGKVIGVRSADLYEEEDIKPWTRRPSRTLPKRRIGGPLPSQVKVVLAGRLFVPKTGLPSPLLNQIKRLAAFQNPEFYKRQNMRLSTAITPRVIYCFEDSPLHIELPRGCLGGLRILLEENGVSLEIDDKRVDGTKIDVTFSGTLMELQKEAATALLEHDIGVFVAPPGIGKTVVGVNLIAARRVSTLVLVHRKPLLDQWRNQLAMFLGLNLKEIGQIGGQKNKPNRKLDVATFQSLVRKDEVKDIVADYGHVVIDECHHVPSVSFERVLSEVRAKYITGLTATPKRRDGRHPISQMQLGPVRYFVDLKTQAAKRPFGHKLIVRDTEFKLKEEDLSIQ